MSHLSEFHDRIVTGAARMTPSDAVDFLLGHGLLAVASHPGLPAEVCSRIVEETQRQAASNLLRIHEFQSLVDAAGEVPMCPLKGLYFLDRIYDRELGGRYLRDIDILVPAEREGELLASLERAGVATPCHRGAISSYVHDRNLRTAGGLLDVHTRLSFKHGVHSTWEDLEPEPGTIHDRQVWELSRETTLVHLLTHMLRHGPLSRLGWIEDILRWTDHGVNEAETLRVARRLGARRSVLAASRLLECWTGEPILPGSTRSSASPDALGRLNHRIFWGRIDRQATPPPTQAGKLERNLSPLLLADRPGDAARHVWAKTREVWERNRPRRPPP